MFKNLLETNILARMVVVVLVGSWVGDEQTLVLLVMSPGWLSVYIIFITKCSAVSVPACSLLQQGHVLPCLTN